MPVVTLPTSGGETFSAAEVGRKYVFELEPGYTGTPVAAGGAAAWIECDSLPEVFIWVRQILNPAGGGLIGCTFTPVFAVSNIDDTGGTTVAEWLPLTAPQIIPFGGTPPVPIYFRDRIPGASAIGLQLTTPAGAAPADNCVFEVVLGASQ